MALKDTWVNRQNEIDDVDAEDINSVAQAVIQLEENKQSQDEKIEEIESMLEELNNSINGVAEDLHLINEGGIE